MPRRKVLKISVQAAMLEQLPAVLEACSEEKADARVLPWTLECVSAGPRWYQVGLRLFCYFLAWKQGSACASRWEGF